MKVFDSRGWRTTSSRIPGGKREMISDAWVSEVVEVPDGETRSVEVRRRMRYRPVEGKSDWS